MKNILWGRSLRLCCWQDVDPNAGLGDKSCLISLPDNKVEKADAELGPKNQTMKEPHTCTGEQTYQSKTRGKY